MTRVQEDDPAVCYPSSQLLRADIIGHDKTITACQLLSRALMRILKDNKDHSVTDEALLPGKFIV